MGATKTRNQKQRTAQLRTAAAGLMVGADVMIEEVAREARPEAADAAAMLFAQAVKARMGGRVAFARWWYGQAEEERAVLRAMGAGVAKRKGLPEGLSPARVLRAYYEGRGVDPKQLGRGARG